MNIAVVAEYVDSHRGGAETSTLQFMIHLVRSGMEVHLYSRSELSGKTDFELHRIHGSDAGLFHTLEFSRRVDALLAGHSHDIVHAITPCLSADVYQPRGGVVAESIARNVAIRSTVLGRTFKKTLNLFNLKQKSLLSLERRLLNRRPAPPIVIALSHYVAEHFHRHYGLGAGHVHRVFNGVDWSEVSDEQKIQLRHAIREKHGIAQDQPTALIVAHNFKLKGLAKWIEAVSHLQKPNGNPRFVTLVVGKDDPAPYRRLAERLGVLEQVLFAGAAADIWGYYAAADILVHPTYYDPCSRVVLEAMLCGLPCLTTAYNGAAEVIEDRETGRVVTTPDDVAVLAQAAEDLTDPRYREALSRRHADFVEQLSMARHTRETMALYGRLR